MTSDPVVIKASAAATLAISVYYPLGTVVPLTLNYRNAESNVVLSGDRTNAVPSDPQGKRLGYTPFLTAVQVENLGASGAIVVMGDSMTDGGSNHWPAMLANRLAAAGKPYAVLNAAVGGNRLLRDTEDPAYGGQSALKRFDRDVLSQPRVKYLILYEGINDICMEDGIHLTSSAREIESAISSLTGRAHAHGIRVYVATLVQIKGRPSDYYSPAKEDVRKEVNRWIRSTKNIDAVVDFDHAVADSSDPDKMDGRFHNGDFHPNEEGNRILSDSFDLRLFR
jgi:lysophospholipase L1-like esterase